MWAGLLSFAARHPDADFTELKPQTSDKGVSKVTWMAKYSKTLSPIHPEIIPPSTPGCKAANIVSVEGSRPGHCAQLLIWRVNRTLKQWDAPHGSLTPNERITLRDRHNDEVLMK
jgi:hypothetical protein